MFYNDFFKCMGFLLKSISVYHVCAMPTEARIGCWIFWTGIKDSCEMPASFRRKLLNISNPISSELNTDYTESMVPLNSIAVPWCHRPVLISWEKTLAIPQLKMGLILALPQDASGITRGNTGQVQAQILQPCTVSTQDPLASPPQESTHRDTPSSAPQNT